MRDNTYEEIKARLTMPQVAGHYGYEPNRSGFLRCPFHSGDHTASLKVYPGNGGWYCFGCGKGGGPVEFVRELFNLSKKEAVAKLNMDFSLGLPIGRQMSHDEKERLHQEAAKRREEIEREREEQEREELKEIRLIWEYQHCWEMYQNPDLFRQVRELYIVAVKKLPFLEYQLDTIADNRSFVSSHNKTIQTIQTISHIDIRNLCQVKEDPEMTQRFLKECAKSNGREENNSGANRQGKVDLHQRGLFNWEEAL